MRFKREFMSIAVAGCSQEKEDDQILSSTNMDGIVKDSSVCATVKDLTHPSSKGQRYLAALFRKAGIVLEENDPANDKFKACLDPQLELSTLGLYDPALDKLTISGRHISITERLITARHEIHHRKQSQAGLPNT
jgi:hypothetical protein